MPGRARRDERRRHERERREEWNERHRFPTVTRHEDNRPTPITNSVSKSLVVGYTWCVSKTCTYTVTNRSN